MRTARATEARMAKVDERYAARLRSRGYVVLDPQQVTSIGSRAVRIDGLPERLVVEPNDA